MRAGVERRHARARQAFQRIAPQGVELGDGNERAVVGVERHAGQAVGRAAGLAQLRRHAIAVEFAAARRLDDRTHRFGAMLAVAEFEHGGTSHAQRQPRVHGKRLPLAGDKRLRLTHLRFRDQSDQLVAAPRAGTCREASRRAGQLNGTVGQVEAIAPFGKQRTARRAAVGLGGCQMHRSAARVGGSRTDRLRRPRGGIRRAAGRWRFSALSFDSARKAFAVRAAGAQDQRVLRVDVGVQSEHAVADRGAYRHAQMVRAGTEHQFGVVDAVEVAAREAAAVEYLPQRFEVARRGGIVDRGAVGGGDHGDVLGALEAAFDLEAVHAGGAQVVEGIEGAEIPGGQQVTLDPVHAIAHPAGLGAAPAVAAAPADEARKQALPGAGHAQRAVDKDLQLDAQPRTAADLLERHLAREHGAGKAVLRQERRAGAVVHRHLRAGVQREFRRDGAHGAGDAEVLHQYGVRVGGGDRLDRARHRRQLVLADHGVQRHVHAHAAGVTVADRLAQLVLGEVVGAAAGVEVAGAQIDGVRAALDGGDQRRHAACRGEQFGLIPHDHASPVLRAGARFPRAGGGSRRATSSCRPWR